MNKLRRFLNSIEIDLKVTISLVFILLLVGTIFYMIFEKWSMIDSLYFCVVTMATVGYGDFSPHTTVGKLFTIVYIFLSIGTFVALCTQLADLLIQRRKTKTQAKEKLKQGL